jgi:hypothetical protein
MWPGSVEVPDPLGEDPAQMPLTERNQKIEAFPANRADRPLADAIRLRNPDGRLVRIPDEFDR